MNCQLYIFDCLTGKLRVSDGDFMTIGKGRKNTFRVMMASEAGGAFAQRNGICRFFPRKEVCNYSLNSAELTGDCLIKSNTHYLFVLSGGCFIAWYGDEAIRPDFSRFDPRTWYVYTPETREWTSAKALLELPTLPEALCETALATFEGLGHYAFRLKDVLKVAAFIARTDGAVQRAHTQGHTPKGKHRCPFCWSTFFKEEALYIATHPALIGDDKLGPEEMQRFSPERKDDEGFALDFHGSRCHEQACPHCHHKLPPFFAQMSQLIFSVIGVASSGKSYFMTSLVQEMERAMSREFNLPFRDADPSSNAPLNEMRMRVFTAGDPESAYRGKEQLRRRLFRRVWKDGAYTNMPRPFIYTLNRDSRGHTLVMYNGNTGSPTPASHNPIKVADAIFFLFDPTANPGFRSLLRDSDDPQLQQCLVPPGRQGLLLSETEMQLRTTYNLPPGQKINTPLAVIIGKGDTWRNLLGPEPLLPIVRNGKLKPENISINSERLRELLFRISPNICTGAEAISDNVCYFATSSLGASPVEFTDSATGNIHLSPKDGNLQPSRVTEPLIWALSCLEPSLFPGSNS